MSDSKSVVSVRIGDDMKKEVEKYRVDRDMSQADAFRELVRTGLEAEELGERLDRMENRLNAMITGDDLKDDLRKIHDELSEQRKDIRELQEQQDEPDGILSRLF